MLRNLLHSATGVGARAQLSRLRPRLAIHVAGVQASPAASRLRSSSIAKGVASAATVAALVSGRTTRNAGSSCEAQMSLSALVGPPTAALVAPGNCQFTPEWSEAKLLERLQVTHDTILLTFGLPDESKPLGLSTCACILAKIDEEGTPTPIVRPYTPISTNALVGKVQLLVKLYDGGKLSNHMNQMPIGAALNFKHVDPNVKLQYPFKKKNITMLVGGTGITPMLQALHAILGTSGDGSKVSLVFGNKTQTDILGKEVLDDWAAKSGGRLKVVHVLSGADDDAAWTGKKGFINRAVLEEVGCSSSDKDALVIICGPPPMYQALCGPRDKAAEVSGVLGEMGFAADQVYKF